MATQASFVENFILAMTSQVCRRNASMEADFRPCFSALVLPLGAPRFFGEDEPELILLFGKKFEGGLPPSSVSFRCFGRKLVATASFCARRSRGAMCAAFAAAL